MPNRLQKSFFIALWAGIASVAAATLVHAETTEVRIGDGFGLSYLPTYIALDQHMFEKRLREAGLASTKVSNFKISSGTAGNDALLAGSADLVMVGLTSMLILWDKTKGTPNEVRGALAICDSPLYFNTINPRIKSVADFTDADRISMPAPTGTTHAMTLQLATVKTFGWDNRHKFDHLVVTMTHPDATVALLSDHEPRTHSSSIPFLFQELADPRVHTIINSYELMGGKQTLIFAYVSSKWKTANPKTYSAIINALRDAIQFINQDKRAAAEIFVRMTNSKMSADDIYKILLQEDKVSFSPAPSNSMVLADYMFRDGLIKTQPKSWKDYFWENVHNEPGS